ncbi:MAG: hypothetical protein LBJ96_04875 [Holosporaceae bacterium]|jgi:hypothetical protein|nr:hypothetical protein [Holosporaceae bacterium]
MKRIFFLFIFLGVFSVFERVEAWSLPSFGKKSEEVSSLDKIASVSGALGKLLASLSTSTDSFTQKSWSGENDVSTLLALRIFCKNSSEFLCWFERVCSSFKSNFEKLQKAQKDLDSANSYTRKVETKTKKVDEAENKVSEIKDALCKNVEVAFGNPLKIVAANAKSSATILMLSIRQLDFSLANIDTTRKNCTNLKKKVDETSAALKGFESAIQGIKSAGGDEIEVNDEAVKKLDEDVNTILDVISAFCEHFQKETNGSVTDELLSRSSLVGDADSEEHDDDDDGSSEKKSSKKKGSAGSKKKQENDDGDDDEGDEEDDE